jgi:hypothetical protein
MKKAIVFFLSGLVVGAAAGVLVPRWVGPRLPQVLRPEESVVVGTVVAKQRRDGQLLLTVDTADGAVLATFGEKVDEITLLIDEGDTVGLGLRGYEPFADDPPIRRVIKKKPSPPAVAPTRPDLGAEPVGGGEPPAAVEAPPPAPRPDPAPPVGPGGAAGEESSDPGEPDAPPGR